MVATTTGLPSVDAYAWDLPLELAAPLLGHGRGGVVPPHVEHVPEIMELGSQSNTAVGVQGADLVEVLAELAESADVLGVEELDGDV